MTDYEKYSLFVTGLGTIATFLVVIVAIWGERIRLWWIQPELKISLSDPHGSLTTRRDGKKARYYSLDVVNKKRTSPAKNVRVLLTGIEKKGPDEKWKPITFSAPVHVTWKWPNITPPYATIGPDEMSTFGFVVEDGKQFELQLYWCPTNLVPAFPSHEPVRLVFKAVSDTVESNALTVKIAWDGKWKESSNEMQQHLIVESI